LNSFHCFVVNQRPDSSIQFAVFTAKAKDVIKWAHADSIKLDKGNIQRELVDTRWKQVVKYFSGASNTNNTIPTNVTIAFDDSIQKLAAKPVEGDGKIGYFIEDKHDGVSEITFPDGVVESTYIIDGQHRLKGMSELPYDVYVPVVLFLGLNRLERAFQFVTINNKSHKVPTDNLKALIANFDQIQPELKLRLAQASIAVPRYATAVDLLNEDADGPFYKMIDWVNNRFPDANKVVQVTALENSLTAINRAFPELQQDASDATVVLNAIWRKIFGMYGITYQNANEYPNLVMKATIQTITEMIVNKLKNDFDPVFTNEPVTAKDGEAAASTAEKMITNIPSEFWKEPWALKSLDTSAGRAIIEKDIRDVKRAIQQSMGQADPKPADWKAVSTLYRTAIDDEILG
jgi:DGQHR domain-containing protein